MLEKRAQLIRNAAERGKYAALYHHLEAMPVQITEWNTSFKEMEAILGFSLPVSARLHRPWWANQKLSNGHSHAWAWLAAGWKTAAVELDREKLVFIRLTPSVSTVGRTRIDLDSVFPPHQAGPWPQGVTLSREEIYSDSGR